jgi:predicted DNA-binding transcriptional regulator AlpA
MQEIEHIESKKLSRRFARAKATSEHFQIAKSTLWLWAKKRPGFPQPLKAGQKVTLFDLNAIEDFLISQANKGDTDGCTD